MERSGIAIGAILLCFPLTAQPAVKCGGGRFVAHAAAEPVPPVLVVVGDNGRVSGLGSCKVHPQKGGRKWRLRAKLTGCADAPRKVSLRGRWADGCDALTLSMRGKRFRRTLDARQSACGDGFVDGARNEQCESFADCPPRETCSNDCRCLDIGTLPSDDTDCIPGALEARLGLDRTKPDSDGDGIDDGAEDLDGDGLSNCDEVARGTKLDDVDTDGDGSSDLAEVMAGTDPLTAPRQVLRPGEIVSGEIAPDAVRRYRFELDSPRHVLIRAIDTTGDDTFVMCVSTVDGAGTSQGPKTCGDGFAHVARSFAAGTYDIGVWELDATGSRTFQLQYLPLEEGPETTLPAGPDAQVEGELSGGLARIHGFVLDGPRRVTVRIEAHEDGTDFEPCFWILTAAGERVPQSIRCGPKGDRDVNLAAGSYFVVVTGKDNTSSGAYRLRVLPFEPAFARDLSTEVQCRTLDGPEDFDIYRLDLSSKPSELILTIVPGESEYLPCVGLWDEQAKPLFGVGPCSGPGEIVLRTGTYYATVHADPLDATGFYCVSLQ